MNMHANKTQNGEKRCSSPEKIWKMKLKNQVELQQTINTMESGKLSYSIQPISLISKWNSLKAFIDQFTSMNSKLMPVVALAFSYHESASLMYDVLARRLCALWIFFVQTWHIPILYHLKAERWENHFSISILNSTHLLIPRAHTSIQRACVIHVAVLSAFSSSVTFCYNELAFIVSVDDKTCVSIECTV